MNLLGIRKEFIKKSGRYDLVTSTTTWVDNGADFYINAGQKRLDQMLESRSQMSTIRIPMLSGGYLVDMGRIARIIKSVRIVNADGSFLPLSYKSTEWLSYEMGKDAASIDASTPAYWTCKIASSPASARKIYIVPPTFDAVNVDVEGFFLSADLVTQPDPAPEDGSILDESFWTVNHPELLIKAALWQLEVFYRNTEGAKDWYNAIQTDIQLLDFDDCADISSQINQMEG